MPTDKTASAPRERTSQPAYLPPLDPRQRYNVAEACSYLRISRSYLYKLVDGGKLEVIRENGARVWVPGTEIERLSAARTPR
jgi:excisionase family DNA binding protein